MKIHTALFMAESALSLRYCHRCIPDRAADFSCADELDRPAVVCERVQPYIVCSGRVSPIRARPAAAPLRYRCVISSRSTSPWVHPLPWSRTCFCAAWFRVLIRPALTAVMQY